MPWVRPPCSLRQASAEAAFTQPGFVSSIQFVNGWMPPAAIAALGGPGAGKLPSGNAAIVVTNITLDSAQVSLGWTGPEGLFQVQTAANLGRPDWQTISNPSSNRSLSIPIPGSTDFYRVTQLRPDIQVGQLPNSEQSLPSKQILRAPGQQLQFSGRPVDLVLSPDGKTVFIKNMSNLLVVDAVSWSPAPDVNVSRQRRFDARYRSQPGRITCVCDGLSQRVIRLGGRHQRNG